MFQETQNNRYTTLNSYLKSTFKTKVYKLALSGGMTCPNRDGSLDTRGCIFCSKGGSGDFAAPSFLSVTEQIDYGREQLRRKLSGSFDTCKFIAYFQSYTNTYADTSYLRKIFTEAINNPHICALSIATRPDCISDEALDLLKELNNIKPVWVELGLQTMHEDTAAFIRRHFPLSTFEACVHRLNSSGIVVITHLIIGLPGENRERILDSVRYISGLPVQGVKLQLLHIMRDTDLGELFLADNDFIDKLHVRTPESYIDILISALELLPPETVIHRLTGDAPHDKLLFPMWSKNKKLILNGVAKELKLRDTRQGAAFSSHHL